MEVISVILLYVLIIAALLLIILLFTVASKIIVHFDSTTSDLKLTLLWLYPFLKSVVSSENGRLILNVYLFNKRILKRQIMSSKIDMQNRNYLKNIHPTDINISAQYGFRDPYFTGLTFCAINMISRFFTLESLSHKPSFLTEDDYINIDATARLNLGRSLLKLV
jgi:hypothetical protein